MNSDKIKVIAMDLDGTLTQHKQPMTPECKETLMALSKKYKLLMVGAGQVYRIFHQMEKFPIDIIGNYGLQYARYNPDRSKRRKIYREVVEAFSDYCVFVGGSSSFDMAPKPYNKYYALDLYCKEHGLSHQEVVYIGDDYGLGGNDEAVYRSDFPYITIDDYRDFPQKVSPLL